MNTDGRRNSSPWEEQPHPTIREKLLVQWRLEIAHVLASYLTAVTVWFGTDAYEKMLIFGPTDWRELVAAPLTTPVYLSYALGLFVIGMVGGYPTVRGLEVAHCWGVYLAWLLVSWLVVSLAWRALKAARHRQGRPGDGSGEEGEDVPRASADE